MTETPTTSIPNVSFVMKELAGLSSQVDSLVRKNDSRSGLVDSAQLQQHILGLDLPGAKDQRHQQLMARMRRSVQQTRNILYSEGTASKRPDAPRPPQRSFVIPKIKYRHLERQEFELSYAKNTRLINEFYQTEVRKDCATQYQGASHHDPDILDPPPVNFTATAKSLTANELYSHEDLLQRYYDICTKKRKTTAEQRPNSRTNSKFTRQRVDEQGVQRAVRVLQQR